VLWAFGICQRWIGLHRVGSYTRGWEHEKPLRRYSKSHISPGDTGGSRNLVTSASYVDTGQEGSTGTLESTSFRVGST
jgi:hypothetical protein